MKSIFKKIAFVLALAMVVTMLPAKTASAASSDGPQMYSTLRLYIGGDKTGTYSDANYAKVWNKDGYTVAFESDAEEVATVNAKGYVRAVSVGTANITATFTAKNGTTVTKTCVVTVKKNATAAGIGAKDKAALEAGLAVGEEWQLVAVRKDENGTVARTGKVDLTDGMRFQSSDESVFTVGATKGKLVAVGVGEATLTVWAVQTEGSDPDTEDPFTKYLATTEKKEYTVVVRNVFSAKATKANEITVNGSFTDESTFTVAKGKTEIKVENVALSEDKKEAVLTLGSKLTDGTYTVTSGDLSAEFVAEDQKVERIVILDEGKSVATNEARTEVYIHYDLYDQYGESVKSNFTVNWVVSTSNPTQSVRDNRSKGILTVPSDGAKEFTYGSQIFITGVLQSSLNPITVQATVYAGLQQRVDAVKVVGVSKEYSGKLQDTLPAEFTSNDWLLVYSLLDQDGYELEYKDEFGKNLTFTCTTPMILGSTMTIKEYGVTIDGENYGAVRLTRGIQSEKGGTAKISIISTTTGKATPYELEVVAEQVLTSFSFLPMPDIVAEGDGVVSIPFEAIDQNGNPITDFRPLCGALSFSDKRLVMSETNDGKAVLTYSVPDDAGATEFSDVPQVFIATIIKNGFSAQTTLYLKDEAVPTTIRNVAVENTNLLEGDTREISQYSAYCTVDHLEYYDQYGREMPCWMAAARFQKYNSSNTELRLYTAIRFKAEAFELVNRTTKTASNATTGIDSSYAAYTGSGSSDYYYFDATTSVPTVTIRSKVGVTNNILSESFEFVVVKSSKGFVADMSKNYIEGSSNRPLELSAVNIAAVRSFYAHYDTTDGEGTAYWSGILHSDIASTEYGYKEAIKYGGDSSRATYTVEGILANGTTVRIIMNNGEGFNYLDIKALDDARIHVTSGSAISGSAITVEPIVFTSGDIDDFLDHSVNKVEASEYPYRFLADRATIEIYQRTPVLNEKGEVTGYVSTSKDKLTITNQIGLEEPQIVSMGDDFEGLINPVNGEITCGQIMGLKLNEWLPLKSQYALGYNPNSGDIEISISKLEESENGLYFGSEVNTDDKKPLTVVNGSFTNAMTSNAVALKNVERGDKFVVTFTYVNKVASEGNRNGNVVSVSCVVTVGADKTAWFSDASVVPTWR